VDRSHLLLEAVRIAFQDAPAGEGAPLLATAFLDPARAGRRAALIRFDRALREEELPVSQNVWFHDRDTTHVSVVDRFGNALALTQTLGYGGFVATPALGFEYNSLLESYDFCDRGTPNFPVPLRTLRTTMTPTLLLCNGKPFLVLGGAGSSRIPSTIVAVVTNLVDRTMPLREAVVSPRVLANRSNPEKRTKGCRSAPADPLPEEKTYIEATNPIASRQADVLYVRGFSEQRRLTSPHTVYDWRAFGGVNAILVDPSTGMLVGVGDPRRNGGAAAPGLP